MRLKAEQLAQQLQRQLLPVYLVSGDEPLLLQESADQIRRQAREQGCSDREILDVSASGFSWQDLLHSATDMSLFGDRKLVELRLPSGKPGAEGSKALCEYVARGADDVLLILSGKIDKQSAQSKWFKTLDQSGATLQLWPVTARELPRWLRQRLRAAGLGIDDDALQLLAERLEGNLLAAVQEVAKLQLLAENQHVTATTVTSAVMDNARYNLFAMADTALGGEPVDGLRMLHGLRAEGSEPSVVLWALAREIRSLLDLNVDCTRGKPVQQAMAARRVWQNRMPLVQAALTRHSRKSLEELLVLAAQVDDCIKGSWVGSPWDHLDRLLIELAGAPATGMPGVK